MCNIFSFGIKTHQSSKFSTHSKTRKERSLREIIKALYGFSQRFFLISEKICLMSLFCVSLLVVVEALSLLFNNLEKEKKGKSNKKYFITICRQIFFSCKIILLSLCASFMLCTIMESFLNMKVELRVKRKCI